MKWYLQGQTSSKWTSQGFEVRSTRLFTNKCILRQVNDMNHLSGWPVSSSGYLRSSLFLILVVRKSYCLCCQSISSIYSFSHPLTLSLITVPSLMVLLLPQLFCFPWNPTKLPPPQPDKGVWTGCFSRCCHGSNLFSFQPLLECHLLKEDARFNTSTDTLKYFFTHFSYSDPLTVWGCVGSSHLLTCYTVFSITCLLYYLASRFPPLNVSFIKGKGLCFSLVSSAHYTACIK